MQVSVEKTTTLKRRMTVSVPNNKVDSAVDKRLQELTKTASIKGFRPGKVPFKVIKSRYGEAARAEVVADVMRTSLFEALEQEDLTPAGMPQIEPKTMKEGDALEFDAVFEVFPQIELVDFSNIDVERVAATIEDADLDAMLEKLRAQHTDWEEVERAAKLEDQVTIDFHGTIDGEEFEGNKAQDVPLVLGSKSMIPGFEEGIVGAKPGSELTVDVTFPEEYPEKSLAGKAAKFVIKVKKVEQPVLPELNDEFAKKFNIDSGVAAMKEDVRENMERELERALQAQLKQAVFDKLLDVVEFEVPKALIDNEINNLRQQATEEFKRYTGMDNAGDFPDEIFAEKARKRVRLGLLFSKIVEENKLTADPVKVKELVDKQAQLYEKPEEVVRWIYGDKNRLADVESAVMEEQVLELILGKAKVTDKTVTYEEAVKAGDEGA